MAAATLQAGGQVGRGDRFDDEVGSRLVGGEDALVRPTLVGGEDGAEALVAHDDIGESGLEGVGVEIAVEADRQGDVVGGGGAVELREEPQALLGMGQGQQAGSRRRCQGQSAGGPGVEAGCQGGDGGRLEEGAEGEFDAQGMADAAGELGGQEGVAAEGEEMVMATDARQGQDLGKEVTEDLLLRSEGRLVLTFGQSIGGRQGAAIELAIGGQRQGVEDHPGAGIMWSGRRRDRAAHNRAGSGIAPGEATE